MCAHDRASDRRCAMSLRCVYFFRNYYTAAVDSCCFNSLNGMLSRTTVTTDSKFSTVCLPVGELVVLSAVEILAFNSLNCL